MLRPIFIAIALVACSCSDAGHDSNESLVGAKHLPPIDVLSNETVIVRDSSSEGHSIQYELRPDGTLSVVRYEMSGYGMATLSDERNFQVPSRAAAIAKGLLWRVRPEKLEGLEVSVPPEGCERQGLHPSGDYAVAFVAPSERQGSKDDRVGVFLSGYTRACTISACCISPAALEASIVVRQAIQQLVKASR